MHLIETMAFRGTTPWHRLGNTLEAGQSIETWQEQSGLSFTIREAPVQFRCDEDSDSSVIQPFAEHKVLYRSDTQAPLSVVSSKYQVVQPKAILAFYRDLTEVSGFELETAGVLKGGRKLWALARTGQSATLKGNDLIKGYLLLATACDGSMATTAQFTSIRVVCNNTLALALNDGKGAVRVPHNTYFVVNAVKKQLGISVSG